MVSKKGDLVVKNGKPMVSCSAVILVSNPRHSPEFCQRYLPRIGLIINHQLAVPLTRDEGLIFSGIASLFDTNDIYSNIIWWCLFGGYLLVSNGKPVHCNAWCCKFLNVCYFDITWCWVLEGQKAKLLIPVLPKKADKTPKASDLGKCHISSISCSISLPQVKPSQKERIVFQVGHFSLRCVQKLVCFR